MGTCSLIATMLDEDMLYSNGAMIEDWRTPDINLREWEGQVVARSLGGRYFLRYILDTEMDYFDTNSQKYKEMGKILQKRTWVTPTPYSPEEALVWLSLPAANRVRLYVLFLKPAEIPVVKGPRWTKSNGIEYLLPNGFPRDAIVDIGPTTGIGWPILIT